MDVNTKLIYYSHEDQTWTEHISRLEVLAKEKTEFKNLSDVRIVELLIRAHDFGKLTTFFQNRLWRRANRSDKRGNHAFYSAVFGAYWCLKEGFSMDDALFVFNIILHHHRNLTFFQRRLPRKLPRGYPHGHDKSKNGFMRYVKTTERLSEHIEPLFDQFRDQQIHKEDVIETFCSVSPEAVSVITSFLEDEQNIINTFYSLVRAAIKLSKLEDTSNNPEAKEEKQKRFIKHQEWYSILTNCDLLQASRTLERELGIFTDQDVQAHRKELIQNNKNTSPASTGRHVLNVMRTEIFEEVMDNIAQICKPGVYTFTSPCGSGKTIAGFSVAARLREILGNNRKIVYALPFTTLIEQNYEVVKKLILGVDANPKDGPPYIMKQHYLTPYQSKDESEIPTEKILTESWNSSVIVTTFVQLFETLIGIQKRSLRKLHSLRGSIVILDEVQSLPLKYWKFISTVFELFAKEFDMTFIIMTATKPSICKGTATELLTNYPKYFSMVNRTKIISDLQQRYTVEQFVQNRIMVSYEEKRNHHLVVVNTIENSIRIHRMLTEKYGEENVFYLSTNLSPRDRRAVVNIVSERLKNKDAEPIILVSTQIIEAGVDFDFDIVFREISPLDSIIQTSGRGNRNNDKPITPVFIFSLEGEPEKNVYSDILLHVTRNLIEGRGEVEETGYLELIEQYFTEVNERSSDSDSDALIQYLEHDLFEEPMGPNRYRGLCEFQLIEERVGYQNILLLQAPITKDEMSATHCLEQLLVSTNKYQKENWSKRVQDYIVSVPSKVIKSLFGEKSTSPYYKDELEMFVIPTEEVDNFYNRTGIIRL